MACLDQAKTIYPDSTFTIDSTRKADYTTAQKDTLEAIAAKCPYEYGVGVYHARALLMQMDTTVTIYVNDCEKLIAPSGRYAAPEQTENLVEDDRLRL